MFLMIGIYTRTREIYMGKFLSMVGRKWFTLDLAEGKALE